MRTYALSLVVLLLTPSIALAKRPPKPPPRLVVKEATDGELFASFQTSMGEIVCRLFEKDAPKTVETFVALATGKKEWKHPVSGKWMNEPLYDGTAFHRVIPEFMIQGGDPYTRADGDPSFAGSGNAGFRFEDELASGRKFDKGGYLAMANSGPNTNSSQFFITEVPTSHLNNLHTIFGEVVSGMELVPKIAREDALKVKLVKVSILRGALVPAKPEKVATKKPK